jgi:hypothetical protein
MADGDELDRLAVLQPMSRGRDRRRNVGDLVRPLVLVD